MPDALNQPLETRAGREGARVAGVGAPLGPRRGDQRRARGVALGSPQHQPAALAFPGEGPRRRVAELRGVATGGGGRSGFVQNFGPVRNASTLLPPEAFFRETGRRRRTARAPGRWVRARASVGLWSIPGPRDRQGEPCITAEARDQAGATQGRSSSPGVFLLLAGEVSRTKSERSAHT